MDMKPSVLSYRLNRLRPPYRVHHGRSRADANEAHSLSDTGEVVVYSLTQELLSLAHGQQQYVRIYADCWEQRVTQSDRNRQESMDQTRVWFVEGVCWINLNKYLFFVSTGFYIHTKIVIDSKHEGLLVWNVYLIEFCEFLRLILELVSIALKEGRGIVNIA